MKKTLTYAAIAIAWVGLPALAAHTFFSQSPASHQIRGNGTIHAAFATTSQGSIGREREDAILAATRHYVATHPDAPAAMREGHALAPVAALNAELEARQAKFRVKTVKGLKAQFYDVS